MKKFFVLFLFPILFFQLNNCKSEGKGKFIVTLGTYPEVVAVDVQQKITGILKERLTGIGIDEEDIQISPKGLQLELTVSGMSNYPADIKSKIHRVIFQNGKVEFWETYFFDEIAGGLSNALKAIDSTDASMRFTSLIAVNQTYDTRSRSCDLGYSKVADTMKVNRLMDTIIRTGQLPLDFKYTWSNARLINNQMVCSLILLKSTKDLKARIENPKFDEVELKNGDSGMEELSVVMSGFEADAFYRMTKANISRSIALVVDGIAYTWPTVNTEINGGVFTITGPHEPGDYEKLKAIMEAKPFPVPVYIVAEKIKE